MGQNGLQVGSLCLLQSLLRQVRHKQGPSKHHPWPSAQAVWQQGLSPPSCIFLDSCHWLGVAHFREHLSLPEMDLSSFQATRRAQAFRLDLGRVPILMARVGYDTTQNLQARRTSNTGYFFHLKRCFLFLIPNQFKLRNQLPVCPYHLDYENLTLHQICFSPLLFFTFWVYVCTCLYDAHVLQVHMHMCACMYVCVWKPEVQPCV